MKDIKLGNYHTGQGQTTCLYWEGNKYIHVLIPEFPLSVHRKHRAETRHITPVLFKGRPYPMARALKTYRRMQRLSGSASARAMLKQASLEAKASA